MSNRKHFVSTDDEPTFAGPYNTEQSARSAIIEDYSVRYPELKFFVSNSDEAY